MDHEKIRQLRLRRGLTMEQAARLAGLPGKQGWYKVESGKRANVTVAVLDRIARALQVPAKDLLK